MGGSRGQSARPTHHDHLLLWKRRKYLPVEVLSGCTVMSTRPVRHLPLSIDGRKRALAEHPVYAVIDSLPRLRIFVEYHVACVWDFMSLLKSLQNDLAPVRVPWQPPADAEAARLINEIVLDEESDLLPYRQGHASHFVWYTEAMEELGAQLGPVRAFLARMTNGQPVLEAMHAAGMPDASRDFVANTLSSLDEPLLVRAAVFLHSREEVIPRMFLPLVHKLRHQGLPCARFLGYLERHIEIDGGAHGNHAAALLERLCRSAPGLQQHAEFAVEGALAARHRLWDAIVAAV